MSGEPFPSDLRPGGVDVWLRGIRADYVGVPVFADLSLRLRAGAWVCLLGPSGVGKTTLLRLVAGLAPPVAGTIEAGDGRPIAERVAYMAQQDLLLPWLTAAQNVGLGARLRGERIHTARARDLLARVGLAELAQRRPAALSGGQRQRVALARTLMEDRPIVLMDEPFSALDAVTRLRLQDLAAALLCGRTVLHVTHDPLEALRLGEQIYVMTGQPARLSPALAPPGAAPRDPTRGPFPALHRQLIDRLTGAPPHLDLAATLEGAA